MTGFQRLQTRGTSNLTIRTKNSDCNNQRLMKYAVFGIGGTEKNTLDQEENKITFTVLNSGGSRNKH